jgi:hypothetical protein
MHDYDLTIFPFGVVSIFGITTTAVFSIAAGRGCSGGLVKWLRGDAMHVLRSGLRFAPLPWREAES